MLLFKRKVLYETLIAQRPKVHYNVLRSRMEVLEKKQLWLYEVSLKKNKRGGKKPFLKRNKCSFCRERIRTVRNIGTDRQEEKMDERSKKKMKNQYKNSKQIGGVYRICCTQTGESWIRASADLQGAKNRFAFHSSTDLCPEAAMASAWKQYGAAGFVFEVLEEIEKKETQTPHEFSEDVSTLLELWNEKQNNGGKVVGTK